MRIVQRARAWLVQLRIAGTVPGDVDVAFGGQAIALWKFGGGYGRLVVTEDSINVVAFLLDEAHRRDDIAHVVVRRKYRFLPVLFPVVGFLGVDGKEHQTHFACREWRSLVELLRERGWLVRVDEGL